jgi:hypothetical protein
MIDSLYRKYFQKSRSFLYPVLGIKRTSFYTPSGTFVSIEDYISSSERKLICTFQDDFTEGFKQFETQMLIGNPLYFDMINGKGYNIYLFDFQHFDEDWDNFLQGKYSKLSNVMKRAIREFYGESSSEYKYIESYLLPEKYFDLYAKLLDVPVKVLKETGELCDPYNPDKETLKIPVEDLEILKKSV